MKTLPIATIAFFVIVSPPGAFAQATYPDSKNAKITIPSVVQKCLNAAGQAVPISSGQCGGPAQVALPSDSIASGAITAQDTTSATTAGYNGVNVVTGTPTAGSAVAQAVNGVSSATVTVAGTFSATLEFEVSGDGGTTYVASTARQRGSGGTAGPATTTTTGIGVFDIDLASKTNIRVRATAAVTGSAAIKINQSVMTGPIEVQTPVRLQDNNSNQNATIKPAITAAQSADPAVVVSLSPNSPIISYAPSTLPTSSITRPANTTTYTANTGWCHATSSCTSVFTFASACRANGGEVIISGIDIWSSNNPSVKLAGVLYIFNATPGTIVGDDATFTIASSDFANLTGQFNGVAFTLGSQQASGAANSGMSLAANMPARCAPGSPALFGMVEVTNVYVPASGEVLSINLHIVGVN